MPGKKKGKKQKKAQPEGAQPEGAQPEGAQPEGAQPEGGQPESSSNNKTRVKVVVSKFHPVYVTIVIDLNEECTMCRKRLVEPCRTCALAGRGPEQCPYSRGKCGHKFHLHCLRPWLEENTKCPALGSDHLREFAS